MKPVRWRAAGDSLQGYLQYILRPIVVWKTTCSVQMAVANITDWLSLLLKQLEFVHSFHQLLFWWISDKAAAPEVFAVANQPGDLGRTRFDRRLTSDLLTILTWPKLSVMEFLSDRRRATMTGLRSDCPAGRSPWPSRPWVQPPWGSACLLCTGTDTGITRGTILACLPEEPSSC